MRLRYALRGEYLSVRRHVLLKRRSGHRETVVLATTYLLAFLTYVRTRALDVGFVDSGEMVLAASTLGILHPPGFPVWVPVAHVFTWMPWGSVAARVSLASATFGAFAGPLLAWITFRSGPVHRSLLGSLAAASVGLTFAFSRTAWGHSVVAEVYALHTALVLSSVASAVGWKWTGRPMPAVLSGAFFGLALGVHHVTAIVSAPLVAVFLLPSIGRGRHGFEGLKLALVGALPPLVAYAYLPWAASRAPLFPWGDLTRWDDFWYHLSGGGARQALGFAPEAAWRLLGDLVSRVVVELRPAPLLLVGLGLVSMIRRDPRLLGAVILAALAGVSFAVCFHVSNDRSAYLLPVFLGMAMALAHGCTSLVDCAERRGAFAKLAVAGILLALPVDSFAAHRQSNDRSRDRSAPVFVSNVLSGVPSGGLVLSFQPELSFPYLHERHLRGFRRDVDVVFVRSMSLVWYLDTYLARESPGVFAGCERELASYRQSLSDRGGVADAKEVGERHRALLVAMTRQRLERGRAVFAVAPVPRFFRETFSLVPVSLAFRVLADDSPGYLPAAALDLDPWLDPSVSLEEAAQRRLLPLHAKMMTARAEYERRWGRPDEAARYDGLTERFGRKRSAG